MIIATLLIAIITVALPYSPLAGILELQPLPLQYLLVIVLIVAGYLLSAELVKHRFYRGQD